MQKIRVLIFEDEAGIRVLYKMALKDRDYEILDFDNPSICSVYLDSECNCPLNTMCADIIITDIRMPVVNGLEFLRKQKEKGCKVQNIIVVSGFADKETVCSIEGMGAVFLRKPFVIGEFLTIIDIFEANIDSERKLSDLG